MKRIDTFVVITQNIIWLTAKSTGFVPFLVGNIPNIYYGCKGRNSKTSIFISKSVSLLNVVFWFYTRVIPLLFMLYFSFIQELFLFSLCCVLVLYQTELLLFSLWCVVAWYQTELLLFSLCCAVLLYRTELLLFSLCCVLVLYWTELFRFSLCCV